MPNLTLRERIEALRGDENGPNGREPNIHTCGWNDALDAVIALLPPVGPPRTCTCIEECEAILADLKLARADIREAEREIERLTKAGGIVVKAFDDGLFVRNTDGDKEFDWAIKLMAPLRALAVLKG